MKLLLHTTLFLATIGVTAAVSEDADDYSTEKTGGGYVYRSTRPVDAKDIVWDPNGYVFFCLCMGRFGNQAEHFLGGLAFAKALNRTLVLPPFRTYRNIRFTEWFQIEPLTDYHRVILAEDFMEYLAPEHWPPDKRLGFCYRPKVDKDTACNMKSGNPFGPFWDGLGVSFVADVIYQLSYYDMDVSNWIKSYPADKYPVLAMRGAPAPYPIADNNRPLQRYLVLSDRVQTEAEEYINQTFPGEKFVGIHLRNGPDWESACQGVEGRPSYMASTQCLKGTGQTVTKNMCLPSTSEILRLVKKVIVETKVKVLFVATDKNPMIADFVKHLEKQKVKVYHADPWLPLTDIAILLRAEHFIGNCISSFTSYVKRTRDVQDKPSSFFGFS